MSEQTILIWAANALLLLHVLFVTFVVAGLILIYIGYSARWLWVRNPWFRLFHLIGIGIVVLQSWLGVRCPLTIWEMALRAEVGIETYSGAFIQHWIQALLYYSAPGWVFVTAYSLFGVLVLASWFLIRPYRF
mgnify:FL=1